MLLLDPLIFSSFVAKLRLTMMALGNSVFPSSDTPLAQISLAESGFVSGTSAVLKEKEQCRSFTSRDEE